MSAPFQLIIAGNSYSARPPSYAFQKARKDEIRRLQAGELPAAEVEEYMVEFISHCISRGQAFSDADRVLLESDLDAVAIARAAAEIGLQTQLQVATAYSQSSLGAK